MSFVWSYTAIDTFNQCPKKFYHRYILKEKEPSNPALENGNRVHKACELYLKSDSAPAPFPLVETVKRQAKGKKLMVEAKLGLNGAIEATGFFDDRVWGRGAADVLIIDYPNAMLIDWKTGKVAEEGKYWKGPVQLEILALFIFKHFPKIDKVTACNIYLEHNKVGQPYIFTRAQEPEIWSRLLPQVDRIEKAIAANSYCMVPGPLCSYCFVKSCPNNRS